MRAYLCLVSPEWHTSHVLGTSQGPLGRPGCSCLKPSLGRGCVIATHTFEPLSDLVISIFHSALTSLLSRGERGIAAPTQLWNKHFFVLTTQGSVQTWRLCRAGLHTQSPRTDKRKREKGTVTCPCLGSLRLPEILLTPSTRLPGKRNLIHLIHRLCPLALRGNYT